MVRCVCMFLVLSVVVVCAFGVWCCFLLCLHFVGGIMALYGLKNREMDLVLR